MYVLYYLLYIAMALSKEVNIRTSPYLMRDILWLVCAALLSQETGEDGVGGG